MHRLPPLTDTATPGPLLARLRTEGVMVRMRIPMLGAVWMTTTDAAARALLKDPRVTRDVRAARGKSLAQAYWWMPRSVAPLLESLLTKDGPDHRRLRGAVEQAFARHEIGALRPRLESIADDLLAGAPDRVDIGQAYTRALPFEAILALLGVSGALRPKLEASIRPIAEVAGPVSILRAMLGLRKLLPALRADLDDVRRHPRTGLISALVHETDAELSEDELLSMIFTLFVAGHETTVHLLNCAILQLCMHPGVRDDLHDARARELFVEEVMRFYSPVAMTTVSYVREAFAFEGVDLARGDRVGTLLIAANHDPDRVDAPGEFVPDRRPNPHLGFGYGPHVCLGMQLARLEASVGIDRLLRHAPDFRLDGATPGWTKRLGFRGPDRLCLRLR